jgi:hypothetical protein
MMRTDGREGVRRQLGYPVWIETEDKQLLERRLSNISEAGARIDFRSIAAAPPDQFVLRLTPNGSLRRYCRIVWKEEKSIGIQFIDKVKCAASQSRPHADNTQTVIVET